MRMFCQQIFKCVGNRLFSVHRNKKSCYCKNKLLKIYYKCMVKKYVSRVESCTKFSYRDFKKCQNFLFVGNTVVNQLTCWTVAVGRGGGS